MEFPDYIPDSVRKQVVNYLIGDGKYNKGWLARLSDYEIELQALKKHSLDFSKMLKQYGGEHIEHKLIKLKIEQEELQENYDNMRRDTECMTRLVHDSRMALVYQMFAEVYPDEPEHIEQFIQMAWMTNLPQEMASAQAQTMSTRALVKDIADTTEVLIHLFKKVSETGVLLPPEFFHLPTLLERTSNPKERLWNDVSPTLLGNASAEDNDDDEAHVARRNAIHYAWGTAPDLSNILNTVSSAAESFNAHYEEHIDNMAFIKQVNIKAVYLKEFSHKLMKSEAHFPEKLYKAIAITALVVINRKHIEISPQDIRQAFADNAQAN